MSSTALENARSFAIKQKDALVAKMFKLLKSLNLDWSKEIIPDHILQVISEFAIDLCMCLEFHTIIKSIFEFSQNFTLSHSKMGSKQNGKRICD